jgi:hypothetical protein
MPLSNASRFAHEAMRGMRPDAYRFIRPDWRRFVVAGSELAELYEAIERKYSTDQRAGGHLRWRAMDERRSGWGRRFGPSTVI